MGESLFPKFTTSPARTTAPTQLVAETKASSSNLPLKKLPVRRDMLLSLHNLILSAVWTSSLHSSRYDADERMRYSCVEPDGETYNIGDIIEEDKNVFIRNKDGIGERPDGFINKIRKANGL